MEETAPTITEAMVTPTFKQKVQIFFSNRKNVALTVLLVVVFVLFTGSLIAISLLTKPTKYKAPQEYVNEDLKPELVDESGEVTVLKGYDIVYLASDKELYATTADASKKLQITKTNGKVLDFIISPDRKSVAYAVTEDNYKRFITSKSMDVSIKDIDPIPTRIYEFDITTGQNSLVWQINSIQLKDSRDYESHVVFPISYWIDPISYPMSYMIIPASFPGRTYMPADVVDDLHYKTTKLLTYNTDGTKILFSNNGLNIIDKNSQKIVNSDVLKTKNSYFMCIPDEAHWEGDYISLTSGCYEGQSSELFNVSDNKLTAINTSSEDLFRYIDGGFIYTITPSNKAIVFNVKGGPMVPTNEVIVEALPGFNQLASLNVLKGEYPINLEGRNIVNNNLVYFLTSDNESGKHLHIYDMNKNTISKVTDLNINGYNNINQANLNKDYTKLLLTAPQPNQSSGYHWSILIYDISTGKTSEVVTQEVSDDDYYYYNNLRGFWL